MTIPVRATKCTQGYAPKRDIRVLPKNRHIPSHSSQDIAKLQDLTCEKFLSSAVGHQYVAHVQFMLLEDMYSGGHA